MPRGLRFTLPLFARSQGLEDIPMIGRTISHYRIVEKIGEGGMGVVYIAEDTLLGRRIAIKTLTARGGDNQHFRARFLREARAVSALSHPNIAAIYDYGQTEQGDPYIVMELIKGETLSDLMHKEKLTIPRSIEIIKQVAEALGEAHSQGIIHRDIKPSNVAINERGNVKVLDFGLAKQLQLEPTNPSDPEQRTLMNTQTREGVIVGTPLYLSPEQALGVDIDARSDLFTVGSLLYECITGKPAFDGDKPAEIIANILREEPPVPSKVNPDVPDEVDEIVQKALAKKPEARYQNAEEMIADLEDARSSILNLDRTVTRMNVAANGTNPTGALATLSDIFRRPRLSVGYVAAGLLILGVIVTVGFWLTRPSAHQPTLEAAKLYEQGVAALHEGTAYKASKLLERSVSADAEYALAHARLAEAYTELDYSDKAKDELLVANRLVPNRAVFTRIDASYFDAVTATVTRDLATSIKAYESIATAKSNDADAAIDLGHAYENNDETDKAISAYEKAAQLNSNNPAAPLHLAVLYGRKQDLAKATAAFDRANGLFTDSQNFEGRAEVAYQRGSLFGQMSKVQEARTEAQNSLDIAKIADNKHQQVRALLLLGSIAYSSGDTAQAQQLVTQAIDLARTNQMENLVTQGLLDLSNTLLLKRSFADAEHYGQQALELAQRYKEKRGEARANLLLGSIYIQQEYADKGAPFIEQALAFYRTNGYRRELSRCMIMTGRVQLLKGDFDGALRTLDEQLQLAKQVEDPGQLARSQAEVASALSKQDFYPQALVRYTESYELNKSLNNPLNTAFALLNRGDMLARLGHYQEANSTLDQLMPVLEKISADNKYRAIWTAWNYLIRAQMAMSQRDFSQARARTKEALAVMTGTNRSTNTEASIKSVMCLTDALSDTSTGLKLCQEAVALVSTADHADAEAYLALAEALLENRKWKEALDAALIAQKEFANRHRDEAEWQAWLIAARANQQLHDELNSQQQCSRARAILDSLQTKWRGESFDSYNARADVRLRRQQMDGLLASAH
jgi:serine/threonine protein kinase/tetratricopeptide (TPR) repeat protein